nr:GatB/YqeY domain-containing protein [Clostridium sp. 1001271B_151109_B4]
MKILNSKSYFRIYFRGYSVILLVKKTCGVTLEDDKVIEILAKEVKQSNAMLEFEKGNRQDFIEENKS